jgi:hypothetical protein
MEREEVNIEKMGKWGWCKCVTNQPGKGCLSYDGTAVPSEREAGPGEVGYTKHAQGV